MATFLYRVMGAAMLDGGTYEQVESDRQGTFQAMLVVVLASIAAGIGVGLQDWAGFPAFARASAVTLVAWIAWAVLTLQIGTRVLPEKQTHADTGELLRTLGFAAAPGWLLVFAAIRGAQTTVFAIALVWMFMAMVVAIRHALDYSGIVRALAVCGIAALLIIAFVFGLGTIMGPTAS